MALTPGGGRSPSMQSPPSPERNGGPKSLRPVRRPRWSRSTTISVLRLGLLIGGLVIITDLAALAMSERTVSADDLATIGAVDEILNYVLFALLGVLVVRETSVMLSGVVAGFFASLLDAIVVSAASLMVPPTPPPDALLLGFGRNLVIGTVFAGLSGVVYALVQRWSGGRRSRR
ncbi:MAG: hypothetical protein JO352_07155 [Chloroflexi bacterium]|nr:hypothetical protein [Chloroflexota bacterium]MBV9602745.1 hypothetical protein [Chloroflexota bacterium]